MSLVLTASGIAEQALRRIGAYSTYDTGPDAEDMGVALEQLDLVIGHLSGTSRPEWLVETELTVQMVAGQRVYTLAGTIAKPLQHFHSARYILPDGTVAPLTLVRRDAYLDNEERTDPGRPEIAHIERRDSPRLFVHPVPEADELGKVELVGTLYGADIAQARGRTPHGLPVSWQLWLIYELAYHCGTGPIRRLPQGTADAIKRDAAMLRRELDGYQNREQVNRPRFTRPYDPMRP